MVTDGLKCYDDFALELVYKHLGNCLQSTVVLAHLTLCCKQLALELVYKHLDAF